MEYGGKVKEELSMDGTIKRGICIATRIKEAGEKSTGLSIFQIKYNRPNMLQGNPARAST